MVDKALTRRELVALAGNSGLVAAGIGLSQLLTASEADEAIEDGDGSWTVSQKMANRLHELGIKNGGYGVIIFKFSDVIISSTHALPLDGDFEAVKSSKDTQVNIKISGKRDNKGPKASGKLGQFEIQM